MLVRTVKSDRTSGDTYWKASGDTRKWRAEWEYYDESATPAGWADLDLVAGGFTMYMDYYLFSDILDNPTTAVPVRTQTWTNVGGATTNRAEYTWAAADWAVLLAGSTYVFRWRLETATDVYKMVESEVQDVNWYILHVEVA